MIHTDAFFIPDCIAIERTVSLCRPITGVQLMPRERGPAVLGSFSELPEGATVEVCGYGYNERTAKVRVNGQYYFVFRQDIDPLIPRAR